ncbi:MAG TPA: glycosyltransferase family 39 protein [Baekduia sp.]|nr:glycosyltransferase family 39 protein [Baekduia sp.]
MCAVEAHAEDADVLRAEGGGATEAPVADDAQPHPAPAPRTPLRTRLGWAGAVLLLLAASFALRVWGARHGLPYAYNADENAHFVPKAIGIFGHDFNPHYFVNPPAFTYVLHAVFAVWFGGRTSVSETFALDPGAVFLVARVTCAALGTLSVWLLYLAGAKLFGDRRVGFVAAMLLAVAFLPVFYSHLALNDVPTLAPICLALYGAARILHDGGRLRDYALAGVGLGLACATKYTGGIALLPIAAAGGVWLVRRTPSHRGIAVAGLVLAAVAALAAFVIANPYALLDLDAFREGLNHQTTVADDALGKLGQTADNGLAYYLWTLTWGLGWVPAVACAVGVVLVARDSPRVAAVLVPAPLLFLLFMGTQERFFGRWLMPVFPMVCLLAAYAVLRPAVAAGRRWPVLAPALVTLAALALCGQGIVSSIHIGRVLSREDTRNLTREWMVRNVPVRTKVVVEPVVPDGWAIDPGRPSPLSPNGYRWTKFPTSRSNIANDGSEIPGPGRIINIEDYERVLRPELVDRYLADGYCWVVSGSTQRGRAEAEPAAVPRALAYYRALERHADLAYRVTPYRRGADPVRFSFDWTFDFYPLAYYRPGPTMWVYHLHGGQCENG